MLHKYHLESYQRYANFIATTTRTIGRRNNRISKELKFNFQVMIDDRGCWCVNYGYDHQIQEGLHEGSDSVLAGETYDLHRVILPQEGDVIYHPKSNRTFTVGKVEGLVNYYAPLLENGVQVSTLHFEEYYKD